MKRVYVIGGTRGLGQAVAVDLVHAGWQVAVGSRGSEDPIDVTSPESIEAAFTKLQHRWEQLDGLVIAAGILHRKRTLEVTAEEFDSVLRTNVTGTFLACQAAARWMKETGGGSIVTFASLTSFVGFSEVAAYGASKAAVAQLTKALANEWAQYGIRVNAVAPGVFPTDLNRALLEGTPRGEWLKAHTPMGRFGEANEVSGAVRYLLSDDARFTTGAVLPVDGGFLARGVGPL